MAFRLILIGEFHHENKMHPGCRAGYAGARSRGCQSAERDFYITYNDIALTSDGNELSLSRTYHSLATEHLRSQPDCLQRYLLRPLRVNVRAARDGRIYATTPLASIGGGGLRSSQKNYRRQVMKPAHSLIALIFACIAFASLISIAYASDNNAPRQDVVVKSSGRAVDVDRCDEKILEKNGKPVLKVSLCPEQNPSGGYYVLTNLLDTNARACGTLNVDSTGPINFCTTLKGNEVRKSMCVRCGAVIGSVTLNSYGRPDTHYPFASSQDTYCMQFTYIVRNQVAGFLRTLEEETPYPIDDYFLTSTCRQKHWGGDILSPMLHLVVDDPAARVEFPEVIYKYYTIKRKDPALWLAVVNNKNTEGETVLDYLDHVVASGFFHAPESQDAVSKLMAFLCTHGGVYAKYPRKCP